MRRLGKSLMGWVLLFLITACSVPAPESHVEPGAAAPIPSGWIAFDDPASPFTLMYPEDANVTHGESKAGVYTARLQFRVPGVEGYQGMLIRVEPNRDGKGLDTVLGELYRRYNEGEPPATLLADAQQTVVSGQTGARLNAGTSGDFSIVLPYGDAVYIIAPVHDMASATLDPAALALFHQVLATLEVRR